MEKCPIDVHTELLLLPKFDNSSPSVTRDKEMSCDYELMSSLYRVRRSTKWKPFNDVYLLSKFDASSFSLTGDIWIFKLVILLTLSSSKIFILLTLDTSELTYFFPFTALDRSQSFY